MKSVSDALEVSRSNLTEKLQGKGKRKPRSDYRKNTDQELLTPVRSLVDERPTYGYRRITALLNRQRVQLGLPRAHDGQVRTLTPNMRWTSDGFEIPCWNGSTCRVRPRYLRLGGYELEGRHWRCYWRMVRDLMVKSIERRFCDNPLPHAVQWLSDNGSCYRAHDTVHFAISLGFVPCFTPVRSPQSNGMAEAFVKTFKRDDVYVHDRPDAQTVLSQLPAWVEEYNESHPHKGLRMRSPREFIRSYATAACSV